MKRLVVPTVAALVLGLAGTAWANCDSHRDKQQSAEAPVETPAPSPSS